MKYLNIFGRNFILIIIAAIGIYSVFLIFSDINSVYDKLSNFDWKFLPLILLTIFCAWIILFIRWEVILRSHDIHIPFKDNLLIYLAGFTLSITPLKSGELIKSILLKNKFNVKRTVSAPLVLTERFYDILGTIIVALAGIFFLGFEYLPVISVALVLTFLIIFSIYSKSNFQYVLRFINKFQFLQKFSSSLENSQDILRNSLSKKTIFVSCSLTVLFRLMEGIGIYFVLLSLGIDVMDYFELVTTYSMSVILGSISMSPGGLGVTEGSLAGLMSLHGLELSTALVVAIIIRFFTLWYGIGVGFIALRLSRGLDINTN